MFHVGQLVVCVDDRPNSLGYVPEKGRVYTIRSFRLFEGVNLVRLEEMLGPTCPTTGERDCGFSPGRFRPIAKTDISIFTAMLTPTKVTA